MRFAIEHNVLRNSTYLSSSLDHVRWISAMAVLVGHVKIGFLPHLGDISDHRWLFVPLYALMNLSQEAVICFFVISGTLVGGKCIVGLTSGNFSLTRYTADRLSRLYVVLLPAVGLSWLLGVVANRLWIDADGCGAETLWNVLANLVFLQNVVSVPLCNNGALWSLSNEFWYYFLAPPLFVLVLARYGRRSKFLSAVAILCALALLVGFHKFDQKDVLSYLAIWAVGLAVWFRGMPRLTPYAAAAIFVLCLLVSRSHRIDQLYFLRDAMVATSLALLLISIRDVSTGPGQPGPLASVGNRLAGFSFSLYAVHLPVLRFLRGALPSVLGVPLPLDPLSVTTYAIMLGVMVTAILVALTVWWIFERHTTLVRHWLSAHMA